MSRQVVTGFPIPDGIARVDLDRDGTSRNAVLYIEETGGRLIALPVIIDDEADFPAFARAESAMQKLLWTRR